jgi:hypothetical protein
VFYSGHALFFCSHAESLKRGVVKQQADLAGGGSRTLVFVSAGVRRGWIKVEGRLEYCIIDGYR